MSTKTIIAALACILVALASPDVSADTVDFELAAATHLIGSEPDAHTWSFSHGRNSVERYDGGPALTIDDVRAHTNDTAFLAWHAARVEAVADADIRPQVFSRGIEIPYGKLFVLTAYTNGAGYQVFTDDEGFIYTSRVHGSPWLSEAEIEAARLDKIAEAKAARANYRANSGDGHNIAERVAAIEALLNLQIGND